MFKSCQELVKLLLVTYVESPFDHLPNELRRIIIREWRRSHVVKRRSWVQIGTVARSILAHWIKASSIALPWVSAWVCAPWLPIYVGVVTRCILLTIVHRILTMHWSLRHEASVEGSSRLQMTHLGKPSLILAWLHWRVVCV